MSIHSKTIEELRLQSINERARNKPRPVVPLHITTGSSVPTDDGEFILLEDNSFLLLEDNSKIIL